jgi:hypothetical protein
MQTVADLSLQMLDKIKNIGIEGVTVKIGFHTGPVVVSYL